MFLVRLLFICALAQVLSGCEFNPAQFIPAIPKNTIPSCTIKKSSAGQRGALPIQEASEDEDEGECGGEPVTASGIFETIGAFGGRDGESTRFYLRGSDGRRTALILKAPVRIESGTKVSVTGVTRPCDEKRGGRAPIQVRDIVAESRQAKGGDSIARTLGEQKTLVILVHLSDRTNRYTLAEATSAVFGATHEFMVENSFRQSWITGRAIGPFAVPVSAQSCDVDQIAASAQAAAQRAGVQVGEYSRLMYVLPSASGCGWLGLGTIGGKPSEAWLNGTLRLDVLAHEFGHNLGLYHSHALECAGKALDERCSAVEYGDVTDTMGEWTSGHFTSAQKERLQWLNTPATPGIVSVEREGLYEIEPYESYSMGPKALKIARGIDSSTGDRIHFTVEYRQPLGFDQIFQQLVYSNNLTSGVMIHLASDSDPDGSYLLNMNPSIDTRFHSALGVGETFSDELTGVRIKLVSMTDRGASLDITPSDSADFSIFSECED